VLAFTRCFLEPKHVCHGTSEWHRSNVLSRDGCAFLSVDRSATGHRWTPIRTTVTGATMCQDYTRSGIATG
jgi:hypothetical protein